MELINAIYQAGADKNVFSTLLVLLSPIAPHFSEELWQILGNKESIFKTGWPKYNPELLIEEKLEIVIQVNGKLRSKIQVDRNIAEDKLKEMVLKDDKLTPWLEGRSPKKFIVVPHKLVNIVLE
jgi:leucyl-tRNA synthetase